MEIPAGRTSGVPITDWSSTSSTENGSAGRKRLGARHSMSQVATRFSFIATDLLTFLGVVLIMPIIPGGAEGVAESFHELMSAGLMLGFGYALAGLYRAEVAHPVEEIRMAAVVTTVVFVVYGGLLLIDGNGGNGRFGLLVGAWVVSLILFPSARALSRILLSGRRWWGAPAAILASENTGPAVIQSLRRWPEIGLKPTVLFQQKSEVDAVDGVPVITNIQEAPQHIATRNISFLIVAMSRRDRRSIDELIRCCSQWCKKVVVIPEVSKGVPLWRNSRLCRGLPGYEIQHGRRDRVRRAAKRIFDTVIAATLLLVLAPLLLAIAVLIKLDSPGPILYSQWRMGLEGRCFHTLKFRSMYLNAEKRLTKILETDSDRRQEYERYHKLNDDPRVTRMGALLRRYSLDELPQLWNVVVGDMSLVGPRAYMPRELSDMNGVERTILQTRPGISGLWQVSGRNALSFAERTHLDVHYVQNWSPSLDIYILARTIPVVWSGTGAT